VASGDLDGDGRDDLVGLWTSQGGVWVRYSGAGQWAKLAAPASDFTVGDMNGDGRADLVGTWNGQGVFYRNSMNGQWVHMAAVADQVTAGDLDGDNIKDLIGIWPAQGGIWVKYSTTNTWALIGASARDISAGKMRPTGSPSPAALQSAVIGKMAGPVFGTGTDLADKAPGGRNFTEKVEKNLTPRAAAQSGGATVKNIPGPGEPGFNPVKQGNLTPREGDAKTRGPAKR
jgi:hypothetical protein